MEDIGDVKASRKILMTVSLSTLVLFSLSHQISELNLGFIKFNQQFKIFEGLPLIMLIITNFYVLIRYVQVLIKEPKVPKDNILALLFLREIDVNEIESILIKPWGSDVVKAFDKRDGTMNDISNIEIKETNNGIHYESPKHRFMMKNLLSNNLISGKITQIPGAYIVEFIETKFENIEKITEKRKVGYADIGMDKPYMLGQMTEPRESESIKTTEIKRDTRFISINLKGGRFAIWRKKLIFWFSESHYADYELPKFLGIWSLCVLCWKLIFNILGL